MTISNQSIIKGKDKMTNQSTNEDNKMTTNTSIIAAKVDHENQGLMMPDLEFLENFQGSKIRYTEDGLISVIDVIGAVSNVKSPKNTWFELTTKYDMGGKTGFVNFKDSLGRKSAKATPVATPEVIIELMMLLPGQVGNQIRKAAVDSLLKRLRGDVGLVKEVADRSLLKNPESEFEFQDYWLRTRTKLTYGKFKENLEARGVQDLEIGRIINMVYLGLFGANKSALLTQKGLKAGLNLRNHLDNDQLLSLEHCERTILKHLDLYNAQGFTECFNLCANIAGQLGLLYRPEIDPKF